ncbi:MAG TPA: L-aspartate oxidase [Thermosulfurimonas dismutans]|uniref:L-aspartate oxidase n=1 Tax=Thermosulfurimonas dismutans TaxID=999894 RepID=A0A7C3GTG0_9BACT|nr:L-aspartate oxidase [Thermosulfurimonas dismutans]
MLGTDFLIIGSGIAGLSLALKLSELGEVWVITKKRATEGATSLAQGGIACVMSEDDSFELHIEDTLRAGDGLCRKETVELVVRQAPERIKELMAWGVEFSRDPQDPSRFDLGLEGGHSRRRILHVEDHTGREIEKVLLARVRERPRIRLLEGHLAVDLITLGKLRRDYAGNRVVGAYVQEWTSGCIEAIRARMVILATGGAGKVYLYTSNPDTATGDGIALAVRAGARATNLEFVQFHPTCLYHPRAKNFLLSEALRGEGARLLDPQGQPFMHRYHPDGELAPRDIVARAIDMELKRSGADHVWLDISHRPADFIKQRFPYLYETCLRFGYDLTREPVPVVPAAHYLCGGVYTNLFAETDIPGLFAVGECACTGLHGANRLASNSLLEALVFAHQAYLRIRDLWPEWRKLPLVEVPEWDPGGAVDMEERVLISHNWDAIRRLMWNYVGIVRSLDRLELARRRLAFIAREIEDHYWRYILTPEFVELRNLCQVARLIVASALSRRESRGTHYLRDFPHKDPALAREIPVSREVLVNYEL